MREIDLAYLRGKTTQFRSYYFYDADLELSNVSTEKDNAILEFVFLA